MQYIAEAIHEECLVCYHNCFDLFQMSNGTAECDITLFVL